MLEDQGGEGSASTAVSRETLNSLPTGIAANTNVHSLAACTVAAEAAVKS